MTVEQTAAGTAAISVSPLHEAVELTRLRFTGVFFFTSRDVM